MRVWHGLAATAAVAVGMGVGRDPAGAAFLIVFCTGTAELGLGLVSVMALFQTVGAIGEAKGFAAHAEALAATAVVLSVGTFAMSACLFFGFWLMSWLI